MKRTAGRWIRRLLLVFAIALPMLLHGTAATAKAATPAFKEKEVEIHGIGEEYQLKISNKPAKSKYKWSSSNKKVAKVDSSGLVTSVNKGTAEIECRITYSNGKTKYLYCDITVLIPAEKIKINNTSEKNGAHIMRVGESYDFNRTLSPSNSTDKTYWSLDASSDDANPNAVRIDDSKVGKVTALRSGKIVLVATAARESNEKSAKKSIVKDAVIIEVVGSAPEVLSASIINSKQIRVEFGAPVQSSTVINSNGTLSGKIRLSRFDSKEGEAKDPGILRGTLSGNLKTLTITADNYFNGHYGITFEKGILTSGGEAVYPDYFELDYTAVVPDDPSNNTGNTDDDNSGTPDPMTPDTDAPRLVQTVLNDNGTTNIITFSEKMDFSGFTVSDAKLVAGSSSAAAGSISFLNTKSNYSFSSDGKSVYIDLAGINSGDYNKTFSIAISGVTDTSGNRLAGGSVIVTLRTDTSSKAQARPISIIRTAYDTVTATFSRAIKVPGYAYINGSYASGKVDANDNRKVNYELSYYEQTLSGTQTVSIGFWDSFNVLPQDTYAEKMYDFKVNFTTEKVRPQIISHDYNPALNLLTLTFNEKVELYLTTDSLEYTMSSNQRDNIQGFLQYTQASAVGNVIELLLSDMTLYGDYTFTLPEGFARDTFQNSSYSKTITIRNGSGAGGVVKLAEPYSIYQSEANHSFIYVEFADQLDVATAMDPNNYAISGVTTEEVKLLSNTANGATVRLTVEKGSITSSGKRKITVSGIRGYNGTSAEMDSYSKDITLAENKDPELLSVKYDSASKSGIQVKFSEKIQGTMTVTVRERNTGNMIGNTVTVSGDTVLIALDNTPPAGTHVQIYVDNNSITDLSGNPSTIDPVLNAFVNY
ncbi:hypothetical protein HNQ56_001822 [Anaerotaenia torta]|uniref:Ig-like domain-containing protein n=1 Tax=Anaerotaenia torta TaxID=433293 RepID=UPI003D1F440D